MTCLKNLQIDVVKARILIFLIVTVLIVIVGTAYFFLTHPARKEQTLGTITVTAGNVTGVIGQTIIASGTISVKDSCWLLETEETALILLVAPPEDLKKEGLKVEIKGVIVERPKGPCIYGIPVRITEYEIK